MAKIPKMYRRKSDGRYAVNLSLGGGRKRTVYLGADRTRADELYRRTIAEWLVAPTTTIAGSSNPEDLSVAEIANAYLDFAEQKYRKPDGSEKTELKHIRIALGILGRLYGTLPANSFDQQCLEAVRGEMVRNGGKRKRWCRSSINDAVGRVKRMFRWAAARKLVPSSVNADLATIAGLRAGETDAPESKPVAPVALAHVEAIEPFVSRQIWAMVQVQLYSGARPGEVCSMRTEHLDRNRDEWIYAPSTHKTAHRGHGRVIVFGPRAQEALKPFLRADPHQPLFSPKESDAERRAAVHAERQTPLSCGNRPGKNLVQNPSRLPGDEYSVASYRRAIKRGCSKAGIPPWHPHQLRHLAADRAAAVDGPEGARCLLGHRSVDVTATYMSRDEARARRIVREIG